MDVMARIGQVADALALACALYHKRETGPHALEVAAVAAVNDLRAVLAWPDDPGGPPRPRMDSDTDIYEAFDRLWTEVKILRESLGPHSRELAGLYVGMGRLLGEVETLKDRLTKQDDRITGIATDLQGLAIDRRDDR